MPPPAGFEAPCPERAIVSSSLPVLRTNFMAKCYSIACRLQTTRAMPETLTRRFATIAVSVSAQGRHVCLSCVFLQAVRGVAAHGLHDEFSGSRKVSPVRKCTMMKESLVLLPQLSPASFWRRPAAADDVSRWDGDARSAVRLVAGSRPADGAYLRAGVEMRLRPGWHTYWRYPGDSGVPPQFDFAQSRKRQTD